MWETTKYRVIEQTMIWPSLSGARRQFTVGDGEWRASVDILYPLVENSKTDGTLTHRLGPQRLSTHAEHNNWPNQKNPGIIFTRALPKKDVLRGIYITSRMH